MPINQWSMNVERLKLFVPDMIDRYYRYLKLVTDSGELKSDNDEERKFAIGQLARLEADMLSAKIALKTLIDGIASGTMSEGTYINVRPLTQSAEEAFDLLKSYSDQGYTIESLKLVTKVAVVDAINAQKAAEEAKLAAAKAQEDARKQQEADEYNRQLAAAKLREAERLAANNAQAQAEAKIAEARRLKYEADQATIAAKQVAEAATKDAETAKRTAVDATITANAAIAVSGTKIGTGNKALVYGIGALALLFLLRR